MVSLLQFWIVVVLALILIYSYGHTRTKLAKLQARYTELKGDAGNYCSKLIDEGEASKQECQALKVEINLLTAKQEAKQKAHGRPHKVGIYHYENTSNPKAPKGWRFTVIAGNGQTIAQASEYYASKQKAKEGVKTLLGEPEIYGVIRYVVTST